jgi:hypothetical protein
MVGLDRAISANRMRGFGNTTVMGSEEEEE